MTDAPPAGPPAWRLFVALTPGETLRSALATAQTDLRRLLPANALRWTPPAQIHLTLRFLGDVPAADVPALREALAAVVRGGPAFGLAVGGWGCFPTARRPRVVWAGVQGDLAALGQLQAAMAAVTAPWGQPESGVFRAHLTVGRVRPLPPPRLRVLADALAACPGRPLGEWPVTAVELFRSELRPDGALHTRLAEVKFPS